MSNPVLPEQARAELVRQLGAARQTVRSCKNDPDLLPKARHRVDEIKCALGERGEVWWDDGTPDYNRRMVQNSPYAAWFRNIRGEAYWHRFGREPVPKPQEDRPMRDPMPPGSDVPRS